MSNKKKKIYLPKLGKTSEWTYGITGREKALVLSEKLLHIQQDKRDAFNAVEEISTLKKINLYLLW